MVYAFMLSSCTGSIQIFLLCLAFIWLFQANGSLSFFLSSSLAKLYLSFFPIQLIPRNGLGWAIKIHQLPACPLEQLNCYQPCTSGEEQAAIEHPCFLVHQCHYQSLFPSLCVVALVIGYFLICLGNLSNLWRNIVVGGVRGSSQPL